MTVPASRTINNDSTSGPDPAPALPLQGGGPRGVRTPALENDADTEKVWQPDQLSPDVALESEGAAAPFVSGVLTGTGAPQNTPHGLGVVPSAVLVVPYDLSPATVGDYAVTEGAHDATDVITTVTTGKDYKVVAWP